MAAFILIVLALASEVSGIAFTVSDAFKAQKHVKDYLSQTWARPRTKAESATQVLAVRWAVGLRQHHRV
ncbi:hypothetical protein [Streptomyces sp. NPDC002851]